MSPSSSISPLQYPKIWPPSPESAVPTHFFHRIPIVGWFAYYVTWLRHCGKHRRTMLDPIAEEIVRQLDVRPTIGDWPVSTEQRQIAKIISKTVCLEKGTDFPPALHPEDPCQLLFWGPFDDTTPLTIRIKFDEQFGTNLPGEVLERAWSENWTIQAFIDACDLHRLQHSTQKTNSESLPWSSSTKVKVAVAGAYELFLILVFIVSHVAHL